MHGKGTFFDERFDNPEQFPIAAKAKLGHASTDPDSDRVTSKIAALQFYQLALPAIKPRPGITSIPTPQSAVMSSSAAKQTATAATASRCGRSQAGISIRPQK